MEQCGLPLSSAGGSSLSIREQVRRTGSASSFKGPLGGLNTNFWMKLVYFKVASAEYLLSQSFLSSSLITVLIEGAVRGV